MSDYFYTCNESGRVLVEGRYHLIGSTDYDICEEHYLQLSPENQDLFTYIPHDLPNMLQVSPIQTKMVVATQEENFEQAMCGVDSQDERSYDSMSTGSLVDFLDDNSMPLEDEPIDILDESVDIMDLEDFFGESPQDIDILSPKFAMTTMVDDFGDSTTSWSETEEEEEEYQQVQQTLDEVEESPDPTTIEIIRVPNRAFGKRMVKPRLNNLFTYRSNWIKNGGESEF